MPDYPFGDMFEPDEDMLAPRTTTSKPTKADIDKHTRGLFAGLHRYRKTSIKERISTHRTVEHLCIRAGKNKKHEITIYLDGDERVVNIVCPCMNDEATEAAARLGAQTCVPMRDAMMAFALGKSEWRLADRPAWIETLLAKSRKSVRDLARFRSKSRPSERIDKSYPMHWVKKLAEKWLLEPMVQYQLIESWGFESTGEEGDSLEWEISLQPGMNWPGQGIAILNFIWSPGAGWSILPADQRTRKTADDAAEWAVKNLLVYLRVPSQLRKTIKTRRPRP